MLFYLPMGLDVCDLGAGSLFGPTWEPVLYAFRYAMANKIAFFTFSL